MTQLLKLHPKNPQRRLIHRAVESLRAGGVIAYPTDSCYALGCALGEKAAMERIGRIRAVDRHHHFTLVCRDLSQIARYARVENWQYRLLKACTPGPYTFILEATREVPRRLWNPKRRTIGIRVPDHEVPRMLLEELGGPIMSSTLSLPGDPYPLTDAREILARLNHQLDVVLDGGNCGLEPTTVVDLAGKGIEVVRVGRGDLAPLQGVLSARQGHAPV
jgi:tRNA threonylcarbamoyl adenosine modification protein (Sua5/YciO/YrdC/YwlC family)